MEWVTLPCCQRSVISRTWKGSRSQNGHDHDAAEYDHPHKYVYNMNYHTALPSYAGWAGDATLILGTAVSLSDVNSDITGQRVNEMGIPSADNYAVSSGEITLSTSNGFTSPPTWTSTVGVLTVSLPKSVVGEHTSASSCLRVERRFAACKMRLCLLHSMPIFEFNHRDDMIFTFCDSSRVFNRHHIIMEPV